MVEYQDVFIYEDTRSLFEYFEKLSYDEKNIFMHSCDAYIEGLKSNNGKEIMFFVIALETLANYEYMDKYNKISKSKKIFNLIKDLYEREIVSSDYIDYIYDLRSLYSHQGISNNRIKQSIFNIFENNVHLIKEVEKIAYSCLTKWLIKKGEQYGK